jgi:uncharacterized protein YbaR (Trm112 family)
MKWFRNAPSLPRIGGIMIDSKILDILACPACRGDVEYDAKTSVLRCVDCAKEYPVKDGIPMMVFEEEIKPESE